nr:MAG TPA: hypothetical protein [Caudoviricetes sp.]
MCKFLHPVFKSAPSPFWRRGFAFRTFKMGIRQQTIDDYGSFVDKFKPKKTTDDCYTPPPQCMRR